MKWIERVQELQRAAQSAFDNCPVTLDEWLTYGYTTEDYVDGLLEVVRVTASPTSEHEAKVIREAIERIYNITQGVPRRINNLCDLSLLIGFSKNGKMIDSKIIEDIMNDGAIF